MKFRLRRIKRRLALIPRDEPTQQDHVENITLSIINGITGENIYRSVFRWPLLGHTLIRWFLESPIRYDPKCKADSGYYCRYVASNGKSGRLHLLALMLDIISDEPPPTQEMTIQLFWTGKATCEICHYAHALETFPYIHCRFCGQRPARHHGRCCPTRTLGRRTPDRHDYLCDPNVLIAFMWHLLDTHRFRGVIFTNEPEELAAICSSSFDLLLAE